MNDTSRLAMNSSDAIAEDAIRGLFSTRTNRTDPWPLYKTLREAKPLHYSGFLKSWVASGMFVVTEGLDEQRRPRSFVEVGELAI